MELLEYLLILRRRQGIIIVLFISAVISAVIASYLATPVYQATTSVLVKPESQASQLPFELGLMGDLGKNEIQNYVEVLKSRTLAEYVALRQGIDPAKQVAEFQRLKGSITIQPVQGTDAIRINVQSVSPVEAQKVANDLVDEFRTWCQNRNRAEARSAKEFIEKQLREREDSLDAAEEALRQYRSTEKVIAPNEQVKAQVDNLAELESQQSQFEIDLEAAELQLSEMQRQLRTRDKTLISSTTLQKDPRLLHYETKLLELESELIATKEKYKEAHPRVQNLRAQIDEIKSEISKGFADVVTSKVESVNPLYTRLLEDIAQVQGNITGLKAKISALARAVKFHERKLAQMPSKELTYAQLLRKQSVAEKIYLILLEKLEETRISEAQTTAQVDLIDSAALPDVPIKPKKKLNVAIAAFLGLFVGCGLAFMLEYIDTSIKSVDDITRYLELPVMGAIPLLKDNNGKKPSTRKRNKAMSVASDKSDDPGTGGVEVGQGR